MIICLCCPNLCDPITAIIIEILIGIIFLEAFIIFCLWFCKCPSRDNSQQRVEKKKNVALIIPAMMGSIIIISYIALKLCPDNIDEVTIGLITGFASGFFVILFQYIIVER